jgi:hypothetical protein
MEFLDEKSKKKQSKRLFLTYGLLAVFILVATTILVFLAQGYWYNPKSGVSQSGLVFIDSSPVSARITLDGIDKGETGAKFSLVNGQHNLKLTSENYRDWQKNFDLEAGTVLDVLYPKLFPNVIPEKAIKTFEQAPVWSSQSPDRKWLALQPTKTSPILQFVNLQEETPTFETYVPQNNALLRTGDSYGTFRPVEWANDNKHLLVLQTLPNGQKAYIMMNREQQEDVVNLSRLLALDKDTTLSLRDKKYDKYFILNTKNGNLAKASLKGTIEPTIAKNVAAFKSYADNLLLIASHETETPKLAQIYVLEGKDKKYPLTTIDRNAKKQYLLEFSEYENDWYYGVSSRTAKELQIYVNPLSGAQPNTQTQIAPTRVLKFASPQFISFSNNTRFLAFQAGQKFVVYDAELNNVYRFTSSLKIAQNQQVKWMDGHRFSTLVGGRTEVFEYDGANKQTLINGLDTLGAFYDRDYKNMFTFKPDKKTSQFTRGQLLLTN